MKVFIEVCLAWFFGCQLLWLDGWSSPEGVQVYIFVLDLCCLPVSNEKIFGFFWSQAKIINMIESRWFTKLNVKWSEVKIAQLCFAASQFYNVVCCQRLPCWSLIFSCFDIFKRVIIKGYYVRNNFVLTIFHTNNKVKQPAN